MTLTSKRAAGGEIAASKDIIEWTPEGKLNYSRGAGEDTPLTNRHMLVCERDHDSSYGKQGGTARAVEILILQLLSRQKICLGREFF